MMERGIRLGGEGEAGENGGPLEIYMFSFQLYQMSF